MNLISREELKEKLDRRDDFRLVMVLGDWAFRAKRIPGPSTLPRRKPQKTCWIPVRRSSSTALMRAVRPANMPSCCWSGPVTAMFVATLAASRTGRKLDIPWKENGLVTTERAVLETKWSLRSSNI